MQSEIPEKLRSTTSLILYGTNLILATPRILRQRRYPEKPILNRVGKFFKFYIIMQVTNKTNADIYVSINIWEKDNATATRQTGVFTIKPAENATWNRQDERGYVMNVETSDAGKTSYFVKHNEEIEVFNTHVNVNGLTIRPAAKNKVN